MLRWRNLEDMDLAAGVQRRAFDHAVPMLAGLRTLEEDRWFYRAC
jgi:hypothetical protein